jgi:hypothetical protein
LTAGGNMKDYFKYYICGGTLIRALKREIAEKKFKKLGLNIQDIKQTINYKKAIRIANSNGGVKYYGDNS